MSAMISDVIWPNHWALTAATVTDTKKMKIWWGEKLLRFNKYSQVVFFFLTNVLMWNKTTHLEGFSVIQQVAGMIHSVDGEVKECTS